MAEETLVERLKRLQSKLVQVCAETAELRTEAASQSETRHLNESPEERAVSRVSPAGHMPLPDKAA